MNLSELIAHQPDEDTLRLWLKKIPYAAYLGIDAEVHGNEILFILPADDKLIGAYLEDYRRDVTRRNPEIDY